MPQSPGFQDQSHINQVREALWERPYGRASVMVGSGFSRNAAKVQPGAGDPPMWNELAREMARKLYPEVVNGGTALTHDVLKLAQEYETGFGRSDLHKFLKQCVRDNDFTPAEAHLRLLKLPWRDVFTTNWDTLLERTAERIAERSYSVIRDMDEIPLLGQPRIVKLHGSFPAHFPLIFTEEDYRIYPRKSAPFVNTVQQAMMETVFCLIGFSGDDPNFLQWSGWVRDNLGDAAPKIYLAGWLDLSVHRRRMLEGRGVVPIDLARHPKAGQWPEMLRHRFATQWILETFERGEPYDLTDWPAPSKRNRQDVPDHLRPVLENDSNAPVKQPDPIWRREELQIEQVTERVRQVIDVWAQNRGMYPGWLVCPTDREFSRDTDLWEQNILDVLEHLEKVERLNGIRELMWRREIQLEPITIRLETVARDVLESIDCVKRAVDGLAEPRDDWPAIREAWVEVALTLLTDSRLDCNQTLFEQRLEALSPFEDDNIDVKHRIHHERCLWTIYSLDYGMLNELLDKWQLENCDPAWKLRKAALLTEAGRIDESRLLVQNALQSVRSTQARNPSIANASRESWALVSAMHGENRAEVFKRWDELAPLNCNAWTEKEIIERAISVSTGRQKAPSFELGVIHSEGIRISDERTRRVIATFRAIRLLEIAGVPPTNNPPVGNFSLPASVVSGIKLAAPDELVATAPDLAIRLVLRFCNYDQDDSLNRVLTRARIAVLSSDSAEVLASVCFGLIEFALPRLKQPDGRIFGAWVEKMRVALEVLSRLVLRTTPNTVERALNVGLECYRISDISGHTLLARPASHLLERSWNALPKDIQANRVLDLLGAPISGMDGFSVEAEFIDPGRLVSDSGMVKARTTENHSKFGEVVGFLLRGLRDSNEDTRVRAIMRLLPIAKSGCLADNQSLEIGDALWGSCNPILDGLSATSMPDWVYFILPHLKREQVEESFRSRWLTSTSASEDNLPYAGMAICQVGLAMNASQDQGLSLALSSEEQKHLTECVLRIADALYEGTWHSEGVSLEAIINGVRAVVPRVELTEEFAEDVFQKVESMTNLQNTSGRERLMAAFFDMDDLRKAFKYAVMPGLLKSLPARFDDIVSKIRVGMASDDELEVYRAMQALDSWLVESADGLLSGLSPPSDLVYEIGVVIATRRKAALTSALGSARRIFNNGTQEHRETVGQLALQGLNYLADELRYERRHPVGLQSRRGAGDDVPTLRLLCVQLAAAMAKRGFGCETTVTHWLEISRIDPLPEVRNAV